MSDLNELLNQALNRLCKWRAHFAGWQLGTRAKDDPEAQAVRDHRELSMLMRVELSEREYKSGRIIFMPSGYEFNSEGAVNRQGVFIAARPDTNGQLASLTFKPAASNCECGEVWEGKVPAFERKGKIVYWVPKSQCVKCPHYLKSATRGRRFAACAYLRDIRSGLPSAEQKVIGMVGEAVDKAKKVLSA